jgi:hypothetical protein
MRRWVWILLAILFVGMVSCAGIVGSGVWFFSKHVQVKQGAKADIEAEFKTLRTKFKGQQPLLDRRAGGISSLNDRLEARAAAYDGPPPDDLCILIWETGKSESVRICLPFWMLKLKSGRGLKLDVPDHDIQRLEISAEELQRAGPSLLLDEEHDRTRVLIWTE